MANFTFSQINSIYSSTIADYLSKGYELNTSTMNGCQGDLCHIDFCHKNRPNVVTRVWMVRDYTRDPDYLFIDYLKIIVKDYEKDKSIWLSTGVVVSEKVYYEIKHANSSKNDYFTDSYNELKRIHQLRVKRLNDNNVHKKVTQVPVDKLPASIKNRVLSEVRCVRGAKRADISCIKSVERLTEFNGKNHIALRVFWEFNNKFGSVCLH